MLLPTSVFTSHLDELPADRPLLVICHVGGRSAAVAGYLARAGRTNVTNVSGGMDAWAKAGLPVRHGPLEPGEGEAPVD
jgi:rhodanese-related sulfurtransferase